MELVVKGVDIQRFFENLKVYIEKGVVSPYSSFLMAVYDALFYNDSWRSLTEDNFILIDDLMKTLNNQPDLNYEEVDKAINKLEEIGLDVTPF